MEAVVGLEEKLVLEMLSKSWVSRDRWPGNLFQMLDSTEENYFEDSIEVFLEYSWLWNQKIMNGCILGELQQGKKCEQAKGGGQIQCRCASKEGIAVVKA